VRTEKKKLILTELAGISSNAEKKMMIVLTNKHHRDSRDQRTWRRDLEKETWTAGYKYSWRRQHKTELYGDKWSVDYVSMGVTRRKSN